MDSEDSNQGSSASNSSSSSENSFQSSPTPTNEDEQKATPISPPAGGNVVEERSPSPSCNRPSRPRSRSSNEDARSAHSRSRSGSDSNSSSSSSSSDSENEGDKSPAAAAPKSKSSSARSTPEKQQSSNAEQRLSSPNNKSQHSSRNSSSSSNRSRSRSQSRSRSRTHSRSNSPANSQHNGGINISHEDLSDVSDMESEKRGGSGFNNSKQSLEDEGTNASTVTGTLLEDELEERNVERRYSMEAENSQNAVITDLRQKLDQKKNQGKSVEQKKDKELSAEGNISEHLEDLVKPNDEDALDFEAEEGECQDISKEEEKSINESNVNAEKEKKARKSDGETDEGELEEGEVSDEDEKRPEETEPKPVCRFYTRGQCTWGMSCRFLHPGVTDKGNYTMFDLVRPVPVPSSSAPSSRVAGYGPHLADYHDYRDRLPPLEHRARIPPAVYGSYHTERPAVIPPEGTVVVESAWERGLRTAKEMMRKANKRKEQDMDFEDKKMNLTLSPEELEKDAFYLKDRASPPEVGYGRHGAYQEPLPYNIPDRFGRAAPPASGYDDVDPYGRTTRYRELPPHRMPQYEDARRVRPTREVIVERVDPVGRGDEWCDPWMRSPGGRGESRDHDKRRRDRRSYSSNSSYSSSSSSQSDSSSDSSRSATPTDHRRRYNSSHKSPPPVRRHGRPGRSPSPLPRRSRHSASRHSPALKRRGQSSVSPVMDKRSSYSPLHKRKKVSPGFKKSISDKAKGKRRLTSSSSGSGSSDSSVSDSDSDSGSSSSDSSSRSRERAAVKRPRTAAAMSAADRKMVKKVEAPKKRSPISIEIKKQPTMGTSALASSPTHSITSDKDSKKSRREELLKQLRAVEDAIAKKRSKLA